MMDAEAIKQMGMVDFLQSHYGMCFERCGEGYTSLSPFTHEQHPSFVVRQVEGRWLFKDFSSGYGGSLIDFVMQRENLSDVSAAMSWINRSVSTAPVNAGNGVCSLVAGPVTAPRKSYDVGALYETLRNNDIGPCVEYLRGRAIAQPVIDDLLTAGMLLYNRYNDRSYCCFAVHDMAGTLHCLDNHQIDGDGKFVVGHKHAFSRDWECMPRSEAVFVTEGIIDYLSVTTLICVIVVA